MLQNASKAWKKVDQTGDFKQLIRAFSQRGKKLFGRNRIDASITLREDPQTGAPRFCIRPETLLDALWTQLAQAIDGSQSLRNCVVCKRLFTITSDHNKEYCSNACRMRAYRKRKEGNKRVRRRRGQHLTGCVEAIGQGDKVTFELRDDGRGRGPKAVNVRLD
jgi:hypothetical protein